MTAQVERVGNVDAIGRNETEVDFNGVACPIGWEGEFGGLVGTGGCGGAEHGFAFVGVECQRHRHIGGLGITLSAVVGP